VCEHHSKTIILRLKYKAMQHGPNILLAYCQSKEHSWLTVSFEAHWCVAAQFGKPYYSLAV